MKTILLSDNPERAAEVFGSDAVVYQKSHILSGDFSETEYIFSTWGMPIFTEEEIKTHLPALKALFYAAGTVQSFARPFLNCGVKVFSAWAANAVPVAEYTVSQILLANKGFFRTMGYTDRTQARNMLQNFPGNYDICVGIIGAGMIGKLVIKLLQNYDLQVLVFDPFLPEEKAEELGVQKVSLETLFAQCQVISNHLANNDQTKGMLREPLFAKMRPFATFLNTGRGAQVVEKDLVQVLQSRPDLTAILDVTFPEPPEKGSLLYALPNCILTPHIAGSSGNEVRRMAQYMYNEYQHYINNEPCRYEVTEEMLKTMA